MNKIIILILICVAIISFTLFPSVYSETQIKSIEVSAGQTAVHIFNLEKGETLHFSFSVTGGNDDINFWVTDPTGFNIIQKDLANQRRLGNVTSHMLVQISNSLRLHPEQVGRHV